MRPVRRGRSPQGNDFDPFENAKKDLISRMGPYCCYCERRISTLLAVEHIQPKKGPHGQPTLIGRWENFLLACTNCNSTKKEKNVVFANLFFCDRDNTFAVFSYTPDGKVTPDSRLLFPLSQMAQNTLSLTGLNKAINESLDENGRQVAIDRVAQRMEAWATAQDAKVDVDNDPANAAVKRGAVRTAKATGFFSIWMKVFEGNVDMRNLFIDAFEGTRDSGCFDPVTAQPVSPSPNLDRLTAGGKI